MKIMKHKSDWHRWWMVVIYAAAVAWVESAVVFYLRSMIGRIKPHQPDPLPVIGGFALVEVIVHRKGATPTGVGVMEIIPGSMATPGFVVSGKGNTESLNSASHGAGRTMSRKSAIEKFNWKDVNRFLKQQGVTLISAGLDEVPMAYKNIREVMAAQNDLVTILGQFDPKLVKMAPSGERPED